MSSSSSSSALHVRPARPEDVDRLVAMHLAAFPDDRGVPARKRNFEQNPLGSLDRLRVLEEAGAVVAHAFLFELEVFFGGRAVKTAGIATVGIAPEARGRGLATHLIAAVEAEARARGDALAMLYPYRQGFYRKLGYASVAPYSWVDSSPRAIPHAWVEDARRTPLGSLRAPVAGDMDPIRACYLRAAKRSTGLLVRPDALWERRLLDDRRHVIVLARDREIRGYIAFHHVQGEPHADIELRVDELIADDDDARRILFGALGMQRDQVRAVRWRAAQGDPFVMALEDADRDRSDDDDLGHTLAAVTAGPMVKLLDVERAIGARGYATDGVASFRVGVDMPSSSTFTLRVEDGKPHASVASHEDSSKGLPMPVFTPEGLASVLFGSVRARDAARLRWLSGGAEAVAALDRLLRLPAFEVVDPF